MLPEPKAQRNFTDPESRIVKTKDSYIQGYNAQAAVDTQAQIIVAQTLSNNGNDQAQLAPLLEDCRAGPWSKVKRIRLKKVLTQEGLADISGFSQQYISGLEGGHRNPTVVTVYEIAVALGVSHLDLLRPTKRTAK